MQNLEAKKILLISRHKEINVIRFNKYSETWLVQNSAPQVKINRNRAKLASAKLRSDVKNQSSGAKLTPELVQNSVKNSNSFAHTKETKKTKEIQIPFSKEKEEENTNAHQGGKSLSEYFKANPPEFLKRP